MLRLTRGQDPQLLDAPSLVDVIIGVVLLSFAGTVAFTFALLGSNQLVLPVNLLIIAALWRLRGAIHEETRN